MDHLLFHTTHPKSPHQVRQLVQVYRVRPCHVFSRRHRVPPRILSVDRKVRVQTPTKLEQSAPEFRLDQHPVLPELFSAQTRNDEHDVRSLEFVKSRLDVCLRDRMSYVAKGEKEYDSPKPR